MPVPVIPSPNEKAACGGYVECWITEIGRVCRCVDPQTGAWVKVPPNRMAPASSREKARFRRGMLERFTASRMGVSPQPAGANLPVFRGPQGVRPWPQDLAAAARGYARANRVAAARR